MATRKTVLITGCSDGSLGSALALAFHAAGGWRVLASARNLTKLQKVKDAGIECVQIDVQSPESIAQAVDEVSRLTGGALDALVNNAGIGGNMPVIHVDLQTTRDMFELNVFSVIAVTQAFVPLLLKSTRDPLLVNNTTGQALLGCGFPLPGRLCRLQGGDGQLHREPAAGAGPPGGARGEPADGRGQVRLHQQHPVQRDGAAARLHLQPGQDGHRGRVEGHVGRLQDGRRRVGQAGGPRPEPGQAALPHLPGRAGQAGAPGHAAADGDHGRHVQEDVGD
ncbi:hypothetical protein PG984_003123 [Apiospora sp. TS-2023a]